MFEALEPLSPDPILGLMAAFREDARAQKIDLGVGVYRDEAGDTPIMKCVGEAEQRRFASETTKSYIGPPGTPEFNDVARALMFGAGHAVLRDKRVAGVQTPGGGSNTLASQPASCPASPPASWPPSAPASEPGPASSVTGCEQ